MPTANIASLEFNPPSDPDLPPLSCYLEKFEPIRLFPEAEHTQLEGNGSGKLTDLVEKMEPRFENYTLQQLMLIGRVDSKPLRPEGMRFYGSQRGLSQARAEWVQQKLLKAFPDQIDPSRITLRGDNYLPPDKNDDKKRQFDRSVEVHACWAPKTG